MHGNRASVLGKVRRKAKLARARIPLGVRAQFTVGSVESFKAAHALASIGASSRRRVTVRLRPGVYEMAVECSQGVDILGEGDVRIVSDGPVDTVDLNGTDARLSRVTIHHHGPEFFYAIHADSPGTGGAVLDHVVAYSGAKSALGIGMPPGQSFTALDCHFERGDEGGPLSEPILAHNSVLGREGALTFTRCTAHSTTGGRLSVWVDKLTGESEEVDGIVEGGSRTTCGAPEVDEAASGGAAHD